MRTALTVITTAILTAIAFLYAWDNGFLGTQGPTNCPVVNTIANTGTDNEKVCDTLANTGESCTTPWETTIEHGNSVLSFADDTGETNTGCVATTSTCNDGNWLNDIAPQANSSCTLSPEAGDTEDTSKHCQVGEVLVAHDSTMTFYKEIKSGSAYTYQAQKRYCFEGELDGDAGYNKLNLISSCTLKITEEEEKPAPTPKPVVKKTTAPIVAKPAEPNYARCSGPGGAIWEHGKAGTAYLASNVGYGQSCNPIGVVCGYGSMRYGSSGNIGQPVGQTLYTACSVGQPTNCTSSCGEVTHGNTVTTYTKGTLAHGGGEVCSDVQIVSTCNNGTLSPSAGSACSCQVAPPSGCTAPNGQKLAHNNAMTLYQYPQVQALAGDGSDTCVRQWRRCINGTWHDYGGSPASFTFQYATCEVLAPPAGGGPGGEGIPQG